MHIHEFRASDLDAAASAMAGAFAADPLYRYFIADEEARLAFLSGFMRFRLRYGVRRGTVFVTDDQKVVAVWLPPGMEMGPLDVLRNGGIGPMLR